MSKKVAPVEAPVITKLPLPNSDNALVIDLPDGQKLVVGKMATGTVIEVATWRGTGRPDSRTTRLMLGISAQDATNVSENQTETPAQTAKVTPIDTLKSLWPNLILKIKEMTSKVRKIGKSKARLESNSKESANSSDVTVRNDNANDEVQAWLDSIIQRSESKAGVKLEPKASATKKASSTKKTKKKTTVTRRSK